MTQRTYELLAKWVAEKINVTIVWSDQDICPSADMKNNIIHLPFNQNGHAYASLALLLHEGAHLKHSGKIPLEYVSKEKKINHHILNAVEDIRIDNKNFYMLPNVRSWYGLLYEQTFDKKRQQQDPPPLIMRVACYLILSLEYFHNKANQFFENDTEVYSVLNYSKIRRHFHDCNYALENQQWKRARNLVQAIVDIFAEEEQEKADKALPELDDLGDGSGEATKGQGKPKQGIAGGTGLLKPTKGFFKGAGKNKGGGLNVGTLEPVAIKSLTKNKFTEVLNVRLTKMIDDGMIVDTDNLTSFFTGDLEELFTDDIQIKKPKSKILFLIDASGSMSTPLLDGKSNASVVLGCTENLINIIEEVMRLEGLDVDYCVRAFDYSYYKLSKENWKKEYQAKGGGTDLLSAFRKAQEEMLADYSIEGKKLIVVFTDGYVDNREIEDMRKLIAKHSSDVRCMVIGVGADPNGKCAKEILGERNILLTPMADLVIMDTVMEMIE